MKKSIVFAHPLLYRLFIKVLYGKRFNERYSEISKYIPHGSTVVDVCCGDCYIYYKYLKQKNINYLGLDINPTFVRHALKDKSIEARVFNVSGEKIPRKEYVIMQGSLYQFIPHHEEILEKLLNSATKKVIITEPVRNISDSNIPIVSFLAKRSSNPGTGHKKGRFNEKIFIEFIKHYNSKLSKYYKICNDREVLCVFNA